MEKKEVIAFFRGLAPPTGHPVPPSLLPLGAALGSGLPAVSVQMPQCGFSLECRRREAHHSTCKANSLLRKDNPDASWISRADRQLGANESAKAGSLDPPYAPPIGAARFGGVDPSEQAVPDPSLSASKRKRRGRKHFRNEKKRDKNMTDLGGSTPLVMPLQEEEDWEEEIQEATFKNREKMILEATPYGPEDMLHFSLQDLTLRQSDSVNPPATANYSPTVHHAHPIRWRCCHVPAESEQFADAGE
ncbi:hypothetical protein CHARACLAT_012585 [Characodon lateralis]|uniref:Uncharacterized protein n=1 Tax=Characodon lateralis TaxID=208331 RepID=A0ABU7EUC9_9TELE|nr:hypothetical protein [Characodon lateralis]